jgi:hypothetical protein
MLHDVDIVLDTIGGTMKLSWSVLPLSDERQAFERAWHTMLLPPPIIDYIVVSTEAQIL